MGWGGLWVCVCVVNAIIKRPVLPPSTVLFIIINIVIISVIVIVVVVVVVVVVLCHTLSLL